MSSMCAAACHILSIYENIFTKFTENILKKHFCENYFDCLKTIKIL